MQMDNTGKIEVMIQCDHVEKTFFTRMTSTPVIRDLDLKVRKNEFVVLFGPGQCGKTTVLNVMAGLETATSGTVTVNGKEVSTPGPDRGFVYQTTALFPWYTVMQNVEYGPRARGMSKRNAGRRRSIISIWWAFRDLRTNFPISSPAECSSGWESPGRTAMNRPCFLWTNPSDIWMHRRGISCRKRSSEYGRRKNGPSSL